MALPAALLLAGLAAPPPAPPSVQFGPLFDAVQRARLFPDSKTFADAVPRGPPAAIMAAWRQRPLADRAALRRFVDVHFRLPAPVISPPPAAGLPLRAHIAALWPVLTREDRGAAVGSAIALPQPYVVPGGRFREIYYWDSYFTMLGLVADGRAPLARAMIADFVDLIDRFGHVPNGTRSYYLSRSQPPMLALMMALAPPPDAATARRWLAALRREHAFWMAGDACLTPKLPACRRVVRMADGSLLNRYWDDRAAPRDEAWVEDLATAAAAAPRPAAEVWRDLRAAAESGWDFSSRWLDDPKRLASIRTTAIVPVDLNSLLYAMERQIAAMCTRQADRACATDFEGRAAARAAALRRWLWRQDEGRFADFDWQRQRATPVVSAAMLYPLFVGLATPSEARAVAALTRQRLLAQGGIATTDRTTGQQWDAPNGWAPLQWIASRGLSAYGEGELGQAIACRFVATVGRSYAETGRLLEKYDVEQQRPGGGGEYATQDGFGWTNGVTAALLAEGRCPGAG